MNAILIMASMFVVGLGFHLMGHPISAELLTIIGLIQLARLDILDAIEKKGK